MKILHVTTPAGFGGLESVVEMLARGMLDRGHDVTILAVVGQQAGSHPFTDRLSEHGIPCVEVTTESRDYRGERRAVGGAVARFAPDVVHTHGYRADVLDAGVARRLRVAAVSTVHGFTGGGVKNRLFEWLQVRSYRRSDCVVAVSQPIVDRLVRAGVRREKIRLVRNSYRALVPTLTRGEAKKRLGLDHDGFHVGWIGRLSHEKGPDVMFAAARLLRESDVAVSFVGDGPLIEELRSASSDSRLDSHVHFHGSVPNAGSVVSAFDALVISSRTEGTPIVLLEAIGAGVPVVSTRVGGIPDVVSDAEAVLVASESPRELADGLLRLRGDPLFAKQLVEAAKSRVERELGYESWLNSYEDVYRSARRLRREGA